MKLTIKDRWVEWKYWHILRKTQKFIPWLATKLPRKLKYFVVIHGTVAVEPNDNPNYVLGMDLLNLWEEVDAPRDRR